MRQALPPPDRTGLNPEETFAAPQTPVEKELANIWREVLGLEQVGIHDNFFDLGGHSLLVIQVCSKLQTILSRDISTMEMFNYPTISSLADYLSQGEQEKGELEQSHHRAETRRALRERRDRFRRNSKKGTI